MYAEYSYGVSGRQAHIMTLSPIMIELCVQRKARIPSTTGRSVLDGAADRVDFARLIRRS